MQDHRITMPELGLIAATRGMLGFGAGLLASEHFARDRRAGIGWMLVAIGVLSTLPLAWHVLKQR
jgi:hypothetical protein